MGKADTDGVVKKVRIRKGLLATIVIRISPHAEEYQIQAPIYLKELLEKDPTCNPALNSQHEPWEHWPAPQE